MHPDGTRLEVKQSALKQSWPTPTPSSPSWDIKPRTGRWEGGVTWIAEPGRNADIYVLGFHPVVDETADHRSAEQWRFFVIAAHDLPPTKRISLGAASRLSPQVRLMDLADAVLEVRTTHAGADRNASKNPGVGRPPRKRSEKVTNRELGSDVGQLARPTPSIVD